MATFLIDYENVKWDGLEGVQYLNSKDTIYLFYSVHACNIRTEHLEAIQKSGCDFYAYKLEKTGKNALDFYLTYQIGEIVGSGADNQLVIVSNDAGFKAVLDFFKQKHDGENEMKLIQESCIAQGIIKLNATEDIERRREVGRLYRKQNIDTALDEMKEKTSSKKKLRKAIHGTKYQSYFEQIYAIVENTSVQPEMRQIYINALKKFGGKDGLAIYNLVKTNYYQK